MHVSFVPFKVAKARYHMSNANRVTTELGTMIIRGAECKSSGAQRLLVLTVRFTRHRQRGLSELVRVIVYVRNVIGTVVG